jgi:hypothetical protein
MNRTLLYFFLLTQLQAQTQKPDFSFQSLVGFTDIPNERFASYISRKGFKPALTESNTSTFFKTEKKSAIERHIEKNEQDGYGSIVFETTCQKEFLELNRELQQAGYTWAKENMLMNNVFALYQKRDITIQPAIKKEGDKTFYSFVIEKKKLPPANEIKHAEDLLKITSHQYLAAVFGPNNVKRDLFYFSEKEVNRCSILFPYTSMQVIFVWKDQINNRDISLLIIGAQNKSGNAISYKPGEQSKWQTADGIYQGMSLKELFLLNGNHIDFYGWESDESGFVLRENNGSIDFKKTGVKLTCLDCNEDQFYSSSNIINSSSVLKDDRRAFVSALVIAP